MYPTFLELYTIFLELYPTFLALYPTFLKLYPTFLDLYPTFLDLLVYPTYLELYPTFLELYPTFSVEYSAKRGCIFDKAKYRKKNEGASVKLFLAGNICTVCNNGMTPKSPNCPRPSPSSPM